MLSQASMTVNKLRCRSIFCSGACGRCIIPDLAEMWRDKRKRNVVAAARNRVRYLEEYRAEIADRDKQRRRGALTQLVADAQKLGMYEIKEPASA